MDGSCFNLAVTMFDCWITPANPIMEAKTTTLVVPVHWCTCHEIIFGEAHILPYCGEFPYCKNFCNMEI